ncbi:unnamed protein product [Rotaria sordida]|uniref:PDZ domain-containing protein n=1 Tax=Rotaria sordida TaxID=392033 RepID=A0A815TZP4_9BILA|nr:unnamed protein product [Rotaria sordida]CAF4195650.1 unnamed protein product [Rotaria sordida]
MAAELTNGNTLCNVNLRRCRLCLWDNFPGFGLTVAPALRPPHIIQLVESNSPAAAGGLRIRDVILAINDINVSKVSYDELKDIIKNTRDNYGNIELLVLDQVFYEVLKKNNQLIDPRFAKPMTAPPIMPIDYQNFPKHQPRTCEIYLNGNYTSFGIETANPLTDIGLFIQEVFPNSPAANAFLRKCDRIIEMNDEFVDDILSKIILERLCLAKAKGYVKFYVMDTKTYTYFQSKNIPLSSKEYQQSSFAKMSLTNSYINENESKYHYF